MNRILITIALAAFALSFTACATSDNTGAKTTAAVATPAASVESSADIEKAVTQMERDWEEALKNKDKTKLESIIADDYIGIGFDGKSNSKAESIANSIAADTKLDSYTLDPIKVRVYGDVAIATSGDTEKSSFKGKDTSGRWVWTDVYAKRNGRWQAVSSHSGRVPEPKA